MIFKKLCTKSELHVKPWTKANGWYADEDHETAPHDFPKHNLGYHETNLTNHLQTATRLTIIGIQSSLLARIRRCCFRVHHAIVRAFFRDVTLGTPAHPHEACLLDVLTLRRGCCGSGCHPCPDARITVPFKSGQASAHVLAGPPV